MLTKSLFKKTLCGSLAVYFNKMDNQNYGSCFTAPPTRDKIRGEYENKIRRMSPPEKIFEVFATQKKDDHIYMSHLDLFRAICPYNYTTKQRENKEQEQFKSSALIEFADANGDGLISLYEYYIFVAFLQIEGKEILKYFTDPTGIVKEEFMGCIHQLNFGLQIVLEHIQKTNTSQLTMTGYLPDPRKEHLNAGNLKEVEEQICENIFKDNTKIPIQKILNLREKMFTEMYEYEFNSFGAIEEGKISGEDFAKSLICYLQPKVVHKVWKDLEDINFEVLYFLSIIIKGEISLQEYKAFQKFLRENFEEIGNKIKEKGVITRKKLQKMISDYSTTQNVPISPIQINILIQVLDTNKNDRIDQNEFIGVVQNRSFYGNGEDGQKLEQPLIAIKDAFFRGVDKLQRIWEIIQE